MKAILEMDMPDECLHCKLSFMQNKIWLCSVIDNKKCRFIIDKEIKNHTRSKSCPLKEVEDK